MKFASVEWNGKRMTAPDVNDCYHTGFQPHGCAVMKDLSQSGKNLMVTDR